MVSSIAITNGGTGYTTAPTVAFYNPGTGATGLAQTSAAGVITGVSPINGTGNVYPPPVAIVAPPSCDAVIIANSHQRERCRGANITITFAAKLDMITF